MSSYEDMVSSMNKEFSVSELVDWGKRNKVFVSEFVDLKDKVKVKEFIVKLKKDKLWK